MTTAFVGNNFHGIFRQKETFNDVSQRHNENNLLIIMVHIDELLEAKVIQKLITCKNQENIFTWNRRQHKKGRRLENQGIC